MGGGSSVGQSKERLVNRVNQDRVHCFEESKGARILKAKCQERESCTERRLYLPASLPLNTINT